VHREQILQHALSLSPEDRAYVAQALAESLATAEDRDRCAAELLAELQRRSTAYRTGTTTSRSAAEVLSDQRRRQADEAKA
jgi:putative addiction module component (TIGR02574 family)